MADLRGAYEEQQQNDLMNFARQLQSETKVPPGAAPSQPTTPEIPSWQGLGTELTGAARALKVGGTTLYGHASTALDHMFTGFSQIVAPANQDFRARLLEQAEGARKVVAGMVSLGIGAPLAGSAAAIMEPIRERYPWIKDHEMATGPVAQAWRDVMGGAIPFLGPDGVTMIRPLEFIGDQPGKTVSTLKSPSKYGQDVPPLTLDEMLESAAMVTTAVGALKTRPSAAKPGEPASQGATPAKTTAAPPGEPSTVQHASVKGGGEVPPIEPQGAQAIIPHLQETPPDLTSTLLGPEFADKPPVPTDATAPRMFGINWERLGTEDATKRVTMEINKSLYEGTDATLAAQSRTRTSEGAGGIRQTHAMTIAEAKASGMTVEDLAAGRFIKPGEDVSVLPAKRAAAEAIRDATDAHMWKLVDDVKNNLAGADSDLTTTVALSRLLNQRVKELTSSAARTTEFGRATTSGKANPLYLGDIQATVESLTAEMTGADMAGYLDSLRATHGKPAAGGWMSTVAEAARTGKNMGWEYFQMVKLTSPTTWAKKAISDVGTMAMAIPERALARMNHVLFWSDDPLGVAPGEARALAAGYGKATVDTVKMLGDEYRASMQAGKGRVGSIREAGAALDNLPGVQQWDRDPAIAAQSVGIRGFGDMLEAAANHDPMSAVTAAPGAALDVVGAAVRSGGNVLKTTTKVAQAINFGAEAEATALRQATLELRRFSEAADYPDRLARRVNYITGHLDEFPQVSSAAKDAALKNTYTHELGPAGQAFETWMNQVPGMRLNFLFYRTPLNLFKRATHYFPPTWAISRVWGEMGDMWNAGGAARETALARLEMGVAATAAAGLLVGKGMLTGAGPTDPEMRRRWQATGAKPYSFYPKGISPGAEGYQVHSIAPFGIHLGMIADIGEIAGQLPQDSPWYERGLQLGAVTVLGMTEAMKDEPFSKGWADMVGAMHDPNRAAAGWTEDFMRGLVPTGWQRAQHVWIDDAIKEVRGPLDALRTAIWSKGGIDRRDVITGEPTLYPPGLGPDIVSPITLSEIKPDPVAKELWDSRIAVPRFPWAAMGSTPAEYLQLTDVSGAKEGVPLTKAQRDRWIVLTTQEVTDRHGLNLHDRLQALTESPKYQALPAFPDNMSRQTAVHEILNAYRRDGLSKLRNEDLDLDLAMREKFREKATSRLPVTNPKSTGKPGELFAPGLVIPGR